MKLRPHHLLCTQGYGGKGYNDEFVRNMDAITNWLRSEENAVIDIVFSTDDICAECPRMMGAGYCRDNDKVKSIDEKVRDYFHLEEDRYQYREIIREIDSKMTESMMEDICCECSWYPVSECKRKILAATNE